MNLLGREEGPTRVTRPGMYVLDQPFPHEDHFMSREPCSGSTRLSQTLRVISLLGLLP